MREVLDRLREAETALDKQLSGVYFLKFTPDRTRLLNLLWRAKRNIWSAQMHVLNAAAGSRDPDPI